MESVNFYNHSMVYEQAHDLFLEHRKKIKQIVPQADIQHVGSTAIPDTLTKGDLDIQVRVTQELFETTHEALSNLYQKNVGSVETDYYQSFKDDE